MSKLTRFAISAALLIFLLFWCVLGVFMFVGYGAFGFGADAYVVLWATVFLASFWGAFSTPRRASQKATVAEKSKFEQKHNLETPDAKLAHLVKRLRDDQMNPNPPGG